MAGTDDEPVRPMPRLPHLGDLIPESIEEVGWTMGETAARLKCGRGTLSRCPERQVGSVREDGPGEFRKFLNRVDESVPAALDVHIIMDN